MPGEASPTSMRLRRWEVAGQDSPSLPAALKSARLARASASPGRKGRVPLPAVGQGHTAKKQDAFITAPGAKAVHDLRKLTDAQVESDRPLHEKTLEAAEAWSVPGTPKGIEHPSNGLTLGDAKNSFFGRVSGHEVEAELQRHAMLIKGLLRDVAILRDVVWHLADERAEVGKARESAENVQAEIASLRAYLEETRAAPVQKSAGRIESEVTLQELEVRTKNLEEVLGSMRCNQIVENGENGSIVYSDTDELDLRAALEEAASMTAGNVIQHLDNWLPEALEESSLTAKFEEWRPLQESLDELASSGRRTADSDLQRMDRMDSADDGVPPVVESGVESAQKDALQEHGEHQASIMSATTGDPQVSIMSAASGPEEAVPE